MKNGSKMQKWMAMGLGAFAAVSMMTSPAMAADFHREAQLPAVQRMQPAWQLGELELPAVQRKQPTWQMGELELPAVQRTQPTLQMGEMELPAVQRTGPKVESAMGDLGTQEVEAEALLLPAVQVARESGRKSAGKTTHGDLVVIKTLDK